MEPFLDPGESGEEIRVGKLDPLRLGGRSRGEDDLGRVVGRRLVRGRQRTSPVSKIAERLERDD